MKAIAKFAILVGLWIGFASYTIDMGLLGLFDVEPTGRTMEFGSLSGGMIAFLYIIKLLRP